MKRLWFSVGLLVFICTATLINSFYLANFTLELEGFLTQAEAQGKSEQWDTALELTHQAQQYWETRSTYLHTTQHHSDIDNVQLLFLQTEEFLKSQKVGEYSASNAALIGLLTLLREQEEFNLKNIL